MTSVRIRRETLGDRGKDDVREDINLSYSHTVFLVNSFLLQCKSSLNIMLEWILTILTLLLWRSLSEPGLSLFMILTGPFPHNLWTTTGTLWRIKLKWCYALRRTGITTSLFSISVSLSFVIFTILWPTSSFHLPPSSFTRTALRSDIPPDTRFSPWDAFIPMRLHGGGGPEPLGW